MNTNLADIKVGDLFSEESHYVVKNINKDSITFVHLESGKEVQLNNDYVSTLLKTSDQYYKEVEVTKEDSKDGSTLGIRSIWENINSSEVFTVVFLKQGKQKSKKQIEEELSKQREEAITIIEKAKKQKKSMAEAYTKALYIIQQNPVKDYIEGESRVLRGYKIQFNSRDGRYNCVDVDLKMSGDKNYIRPVNINTIKYLIVGGIKYNVK